MHLFNVSSSHHRQKVLVCVFLMAPESAPRRPKIPITSRDQLKARVLLVSVGISVLLLNVVLNVMDVHVFGALVIVYKLHLIWLQGYH